MKKIRVDISKMIYKIHQEWNGEGGFKQYIRRKEHANRMIEYICETINNPNIKHVDINTVDRFAMVYFNDETPRNDVINACDVLNEKELFSYFMMF